jgi:hypothetical protein
MKKILLGLRDNKDGYNFLLKRTPICIYPKNHESTMVFTEEKTLWVGHRIELHDDYFEVRRFGKGFLLKPERYQYSDLKIA